MGDGAFTMLGAALAVVGGFLSTWFVRWRDTVRDEHRRRDDLVAAIRITRYELSWNAAAATELVSSSGEILPLQLRDSSYRAVQLTLARGLAEDLREAVARPYEAMQIAVRNLDAFRSRGGGTTDEIAAVQRIGRDMSAANAALATYLSNELRASL